MSFVKALISPGKKSISRNKLTSYKFIPIVYHDIFDYPLNSSELCKWKAGKMAVEYFHNKVEIEKKLGYYFKKGKSNLVSKRLLREKISKHKFEKARKVGNILNYIPTVQMVAVTGALAMNNANDESDIDLMIVVKKGTLWITRGVVWIFLKLFGFPLRTPGDKNEKDKLCLNIWLDRGDLTWSTKERNIFSAHEIAQVVPLVNKDKTYEKFLFENIWINDYWPNAVEISSKKHVASSKGNILLNIMFSPLLHTTFYVLRLIELLAFKLQRAYMSKRITRETITPTRALFHPVDWKKIVLSRLT